jgi:hypothetical protein
MQELRGDKETKHMKLRCNPDQHRPVPRFARNPLDIFGQRTYLLTVACRSRDHRERQQMAQRTEGSSASKEEKLTDR